MRRIIAWLHATRLQRQRASIGVELMRGMFRTPHLDAVWCKRCDGRESAGATLQSTVLK